MRNGFPSGSGVTWMPARSLGQQKNTSDNKDPDDKRGERTTERETAVADRLVQEVSDRGAEWPREDECCPECVSAWNKDPVFGVIGVQSAQSFGYKVLKGA